MIVVCDTPSICYLVLIGEIKALPHLFGEILIPRGVEAELLAPGAPAAVRAWMEEPPSWLKTLQTTSHPAPKLSGLHAGEREVLMLALQGGADLVILDDKAARRAALSLNFRVIGLLGVLERAAKAGHLDLSEAVSRLRATNFRVSPALLTDWLNRLQN